MITKRREAGTVIVGKFEGNFRGIPVAALTLAKSLNYFISIDNREDEKRCQSDNLRE
jgi:hypothetical protein